MAGHWHGDPAVTGHCGGFSAGSAGLEETADQSGELHIATGGAGQNLLGLEAIDQVGKHAGAGDEVAGQGQSEVDHRADHGVDGSLRQGRVEHTVGFQIQRAFGPLQQVAILNERHAGTSGGLDVEISLLMVLAWAEAGDLAETKAFHHLGGGS